jgi:hypothetical protein
VKYDHCEPGTKPSLVDLDGVGGLVRVSVLEIEWADSLTNLDAIMGLDGLSELVIRNNVALPWADVIALEAATEPALVDICGGLDGPSCVDDPCPMF